MSKIKTAITLYSFTNEQRDHGWSTEDCLRACRDLGVAGVEFVASQTFGRSYPWPDLQEIYAVRRLCEKLGLEIAAYSAQSDRGKRFQDVDMPAEDMFAYALNDLKYAYEIGAYAQRQQNNLSPEALEMLAPWAEKYRVKVGIEMHQPMTPCEPNSEAFNRVIERVDSPYIGWVPDFGMFSEGKYNARFADRLSGMPSRMNVPDEIVDYFETHQGEPIAQAKEELRAFHPDEKLQAILDVYLTTGDTAGDSRKTLWEDFERVTLPHAVHFHGKFHHLADDGDDENIPTQKVLKVIGKSDYDGFISIEYEGHLHGRPDPVVPIMRRHLAFYRDVLGIR